MIQGWVGKEDKEGENDCGIVVGLGVRTLGTGDEVPEPPSVGESIGENWEGVVVGEGRDDGNWD